jgi:hypothetical protein
MQLDNNARHSIVQSYTQRPSGIYPASVSLRLDQLKHHGPQLYQALFQHLHSVETAASSSISSGTYRSTFNALGEGC